MGELLVNQTDTVSINVTPYGPFLIAGKITCDAVYSDQSTGTVTIDIDDDDFPYMFDLSNIDGNGTKVKDPSTVYLDFEIE